MTTSPASEVHNPTYIPSFPPMFGMDTLRSIKGREYISPSSMEAIYEAIG